MSALLLRLAATLVSFQTPLAEWVVSLGHPPMESRTIKIVLIQFDMNCLLRVWKSDSLTKAWRATLKSSDTPDFEYPLGLSLSFSSIFFL